MPRVFVNDVENYGGTGGSGFFGLANDGDTAKVRFLWNGIDDISCYVVHEVEIDGRKRYVNCLRTYDEPLSKCPMCAAKKFQKIKLYIPIYDIEEDRVKYWERGRKFLEKIKSVCARYSNDKTPLCSQVFEIERHGKKGSMDTTYEIYAIGSADGTTLDDLPEAAPVIGNLVLNKTAEELDEFLNSGEFSTVEESKSIRRELVSEEERPIRRTPVRRAVDRF